MEITEQSQISPQVYYVGRRVVILFRYKQEKGWVALTHTLNVRPDFDLKTIMICVRRGNDT